MWTLNNNVFQAHPVNVGITDGVNTEILGGIAKGTRIITEMKMSGEMSAPDNGAPQQESSPFAPKHPGSNKNKK